MKLKETEKAYLAGLIDGEGCIYISVAKGRYFQLKLIVNGTVKEHIEACAKLAGVGSIHLTKKNFPKADFTQWQIVSHEAASLLKLVLPYLLLKADQAKLAIVFQDHMINSPNYNNRHPIPKSVLNYRQYLADLLKEMKNNQKTFSDLHFDDADLLIQEYQQYILI